MRTIYVGVGEYAASKAPGDVIKTMALGSCIAVIFLDPSNGTVGILNVALPDSSINKNRILEKPGMFADTGIPVLLNLMMKNGYNGKGQLIVKLVGGASILSPNNTFNIGKRNALAVKKALGKHQLGAIAEDLGNNFSRSVSIEVKTGKVTVSSPGRGQWTI